MQKGRLSLKAGKKILSYPGNEVLRKLKDLRPDESILQTFSTLL